MPLPVAECIPWEEIIGPVEKETLPSNAILTSAFRRTLIVPSGKFASCLQQLETLPQWLRLGKLFPNKY